MEQSNYQLYQARMSRVIRETLDAMECQPIFFIGSGISKRYFNAPNWQELLRAIATHVGLSSDEFSYLLQKVGGDSIKVGTELETKVFEWAWKGGKNSFPPDYFNADIDRSLFLKYIASKEIENAYPIPENISKLEKSDEIKKLMKAQPHAIITTNYDQFLEKIFPEYEPIVGQKIIRRDINVVGEIFKIHGSVSEPDSIVITEADYENYRDKKKYISAKLLTYLAEHPVFIFGYGLSDPNVSGIIEDIGEILCGKNGLVDNIFYVEWRADVSSETQFREEYVIGKGESQLRVRAIVADEFSWIYDAISTKNPLKWVDPRLLRAISSRFYNIIRRDIPKSNVDVDFKQLASLADSDDKLPALFGIGSSISPNASFPYNLTSVGKQLGFPGWHSANELIEKIKQDTGFQMKSSDNIYHCALKSGEGCFHLYSQEAINLLRDVRDGKEYSVKDGPI
jgi:SIR2-like domain